MTINEAIADLDASLRNTADTAQKIAWLSQADSQIHRMVISLYHGPEIFPGYGPDTPGDTELIMPEPFSIGYTHYCQSQIHLRNKEMAEYNDALEMWAVDLENFSNFYRRTHDLAAPNTRFLF